MEYLSVFSPNTEKYGPEKTPYLDTFHADIKRSWHTLESVVNENGFVIFPALLEFQIKFKIRHLARIPKNI